MKQEAVYVQHMVNWRPIQAMSRTLPAWGCQVPWSWSYGPAVMGAENRMLDSARGAGALKHRAISPGSYPEEKLLWHFVSMWVYIYVHGVVGVRGQPRGARSLFPNMRAPAHVNTGFQVGSRQLSLLSHLSGSWFYFINKCFHTTAQTATFVVYYLIRDFSNSSGRANRFHL